MNAAAKIHGVIKDFRGLSVVSSFVHDSQAHRFMQTTKTWKSTGSGELANFWATAVEHQDYNNGAVTVSGYGTSHHANGDLSYFSWEGTAQVIPEHIPHLTGSGKFKWLGGTGKFQEVSSIGQCNTSCSLLAGVPKAKVFRGR
jgi:hypothetical protein